VWGGAQTAKTARAKKALGSAAAQVKPLSASKDFHDELSSVRAVAGKLLDGEGTQTQTLAQKAPSDILPDQPPPQQPPQVAQVSKPCDDVCASVCITTHEETLLDTKLHNPRDLGDVWVRAAVIGRRRRSWRRRKKRLRPRWQCPR